METFGNILVVIVSLASVICLMVGFYWWLCPRKTRLGDQFLSNTPEQRYRLEQGE